MSVFEITGTTQARVRTRCQKSGGFSSQLGLHVFRVYLTGVPDAIPVIGAAALSVLLPRKFLRSLIGYNYTMMPFQPTFFWKQT
ncbi:hypothetical protein GUJ93_ZPchr0007g6055 [Zizania palustris]|uniref:Uncharacterized protein n=1 Tax=Zizania palustris TaxID=103762 RepID=A0A8J5W6K5_ZIZPA|nr:hypothetical protein GUJ93_ZPchr0007g6055 [Zizania palustris]